jgi:hypothetical protein
MAVTASFVPFLRLPRPRHACRRRRRAVHAWACRGRSLSFSLRPLTYIPLANTTLSESFFFSMLPCIASRVLRGRRCMIYERRRLDYLVAAACASPCIYILDAAYREGLFVNSAWAVGCLHCHMQRASWADRSRIGVRILPKISKQIYQENHELALWYTNPVILYTIGDTIN